MSAEERVIFDEAKAALAAEQREHDITRRQRDTLQTQCEDMQSEMDTETKLNNASLKPSAKVLQQDQDDEMACMAEEVQALKAKLSETLGHCVVLADANGELNIHNKNHLTTIRHLRGKIEELNDSAETQATHMQQVDAACKAAEAKVQEQRKEIEALAMNADRCAICESTQLEEITNRDAVIVQYESRAEDREEIIKALAKEIKVMRAPEMHKEYQQLAYCVRPFTIGFVGKREDMPNIERNKCRYFNTCDYAKRENHTCADGGGEHCGVWRHKEARQ